MNALVALLPTPHTDLGSNDAPVAVDEMDRLYRALDGVKRSENPRTARLMGAGLRKRSQKVVEEAAEVALEAVRKRPASTIRESADLLYHLTILWHELGIQPADVWAEMRRRTEIFGIAEKLPKRRARAAAEF